MRIGKNTAQSTSVSLGRPLTQGCAQWTASSLKHAGMFEKPFGSFFVLLVQNLVDLLLYGLIGHALGQHQLGNQNLLG